MPSIWELLILLSRLGLYLGVAGTLGGCFALQVFQHSGHTARLKRYLRLSAGIGLLALTANFLVRTAAMGDSLASILDSLLLSILWQSGIGSSTRWQLAGFTVMLLAISISGRSGILRQMARPLMLAAGLALIWSFTFSGHLAGEAWLNKIALALHVLAMSLWLGSLFPLLSLLESPRARHNLELFSSVGVWIVALLMGCGLWMAIVLLPSLSDVFSTVYGRVLLAKLALLLLLLALAAANKWILSGRVDTQPHGIRRSIQGEMLVGLLILVMTAVLANLVSPH